MVADRIFYNFISCSSAWFSESNFFMLQFGKPLFSSYFCNFATIVGSMVENIYNNGLLILSFRNTAPPICSSINATLPAELFWDCCCNATTTALLHVSMHCNISLTIRTSTIDLVSEYNTFPSSSISNSNCLHSSTLKITHCLHYIHFCSMLFVL